MENYLKQINNILVVDDNVEQVGILVDFFSIYNYRAEGAIDGQSALEKIGRFMSDVIFLDLEMPGMDGFAVARAVRNNSLHADTILVALTGWDDFRTLEKCRSADFSAFMSKPVNIFTLLSYLEDGTFARSHQNRRDIKIKCLNPNKLIID